MTFWGSRAPIARQRRQGSQIGHRGSVLVPTLVAVVIISLLASASLPLVVSGYGLALAERDRVAALAAAEAGLNWEIARIRDRCWSRDERGRVLLDGRGRPRLDFWPEVASGRPATAAGRVLLSDASGGWRLRFFVGTSADPYPAGAGRTLAITSEGQARAADGNVVRRRVRVLVTIRSARDGGEETLTVHPAVARSGGEGWHWQEVTASGEL